MVIGLLSLLSAALVPSYASEPSRCDLQEADYADLRTALRSMARAQKGTLMVAGQGESCSSALEAVRRNDPFLRVQQIPAPPEDAISWMGEAIAEDEGSCVAVLVPGPFGWDLASVGGCVEPRPPRHPVALTASYWEWGGPSLRANVQLVAGLSLVLDGAVDVMDRVRNQRAWRALGGLDMSEDELDGGYVGTRFGLRHVRVNGDGPTEREMGRDALLQMVLGRRWVAGGMALQIGGGIGAVIPVEDNTVRNEFLVPVLEIRAGVAPRMR